MTAPRPTICLMPTPAERDEAEVYRRFRDLLIKAHCAAKGKHKCCGVITIAEAHVTFNCRLCGDLRQVIVA
jgi:hypothetical protein